jgi:hypothetical protein
MATGDLIAIASQALRIVAGILMLAVVFGIQRRQNARGG